MAIIQSSHSRKKTGTKPGAVQLMLGLFAALAQFERDLISERTKAGLAAAKAAGRRPGRPVLMDARKLDAARVMRTQGLSHQRIADAIGVSRSTVMRHLAETVA